MKLTCESHDRRVQILESGAVLHRDRQASVCGSERFKMGTFRMWYWEIRHHGLPARPGRVGWGLANYRDAR